MKQRFLCALFLLCACAATSYAQSAAPDSYERFRQHVKSDVISLGGVFKVIPTVSFSEEGVRSIGIGQARLSLKGDFDNGFGYTIQIDAVQDVPLVDLMVRYQASPGMGLQAGRYKVPFSAEYLRSSSRIDFVGRSRVVNLLAPKRETGLSAVLATPEGQLTLSGGLFNGTTALANNDNAFRYATRAEVDAEAGAARYQLGANVSYEREDVNGVQDRWLFGGDARLEAAGLLLAGEVLYGDNPDRAPGGESFGYYATLGYHVADGHQLVARLDALHAGGPDAPGNYLYFLGYNLQAAPMARIQVNYVAPAGDDFSPESFEDHGVIVNLQIAF